ncbi:transmembrane protein 42-like [Pantherophis guttatus]|uniref:Transmembrane protein 42 n=1 Tax=Pantherophis guttatus TaxID=94885 RepID=A0A6P9AVQ5_PANGU|nr:transmembrane protein 42 [Pantherophis guttatus]XP_060541941.1 transmembrane protein 42-like [Pantherophis guttatus]
MPLVLGTTCAIGAGLLGTLAASSAKLALDDDYLRATCQAVLGEEEITGEACIWVSIILRIVCGGLVFVCNAIMWTSFAKALRYSSSSATVTVTTTTSNFIFSAFLGRLLFGEIDDLLWWTGISISLLGLLLLHTTPSLLEQQICLKKKKK